MADPIYRGFSSIDKTNFSTATYDIATVEQDLINNFAIRPGEVRGRNGFGCRLTEMVGDPLDDIALVMARTEVQKVFDYDPRVRVIDFNLISDDIAGTITIKALLQYIELDEQSFFETVVGKA